MTNERQRVKRALIYTRVSLDQSGEGRSVDRQLAACRALAEARGWTVVKELSDNSISAWSGKERPAWNETLALIETGDVDVVIAWHVDRMTRSMLDLENLILLAEKNDVGIATATGDIDLTTDVGRMVARILAAVARAEVERKGARQRLANQQKAERGETHSNGYRPFGFEADRATVVESEAELVRATARDLLAGAALTDVAKVWGKSRTSVRRALLSPRYVGKREHLGALYDAQWEPIITEDTQAALRRLFGEASRQMSPSTGPKPTTLLSGIAVCGKCGSAVKGGIRRSHRGPTYNCSRGCVFVPRADADDYVGAWVVGVLSQPDVLPELVPTDDDTLAEAREESDALRKRLDELAEMFMAGELTRAQVGTATASARARLEALELAMKQAVAGDDFEGLDVGTDDVARQWESLSLYRQRAIVDRLFEITLLPAKNRRAPFDATERIAVRRSEALEQPA